jgi:hypothetical protein
MAFSSRNAKDRMLAAKTAATPEPSPLKLEAVQ